LLLYGPPGTGKTSAILACARKITGGKPNMVLELNASDDRGIDVVREQIKNFASSRQLFSSGLKLVILDEADAMTQSAQFALRRVIEKYTQTTRFCLICNYINKVIPALQSRCTRFRFGPLEGAQIECRLKEIAALESVKLEPSGLQAIIKLSSGDMRKCLNVLQAAQMAYPLVNEEAVYLCTGNPLPRDIESILDNLLNQNFEAAFAFIQMMQTNKGVSLADVITYLHELLFRLKLPPKILSYLLDKLSDIEYRLAGGASDRLQLGALVGAFQIAKEMIFQIAKSS